MALFENFPYTNLHELNLDWLIEELKMVKDSVVISVNGQTGEVILYQNATVQFPPVTDDHWSIVRTADGVSRGIVFGNDNRAFICHDSLMNEIYSANNQPPYPVTRVNGQTGDIVLYADQYVQLPSLTDEQIFNWTLFRNINSVAHGIQFDADGSGYIIDGENRYKIYSQNDTPPYPVTSVNGQTGAVVLSFPVTSVNGQTGDVELFTEEATGQIEFPSITSAGVEQVSMSRELNGVNYGLAIDDSGNLKLIIGSLEYSVYTALNKQPGFVENDTDGELQVRVDAPASSWALLRETSDTTSIGIVFDNGVSKAAYLKYFDGAAYTTSKLLTLADIPSTTGVVSINGQTGVVVLTGSDINLSSNDTTKLDVLISGLLSSVEDVKTSLAYKENGNTASQNIPARAYVLWKDNAYRAKQAISYGDTLSSANLDGISNGILNTINNQIGSLFRTSYLNSITYHNDVSYIDGDVATIINQDLAIIQLRLNITASLSGGDTIIDNLPPVYGTNNTVIVFNNNNVGMFLTNNSSQTAAAMKLNTGATLSTGVLIVNAVYLTAV